MSSFKKFRKVNGLTQSELAQYLDVKQGFISQIENNARPAPSYFISKLLANSNGWDTSMLTEGEVPSLVANHIPRLSDVEILLRDMLAEKDAKIDALHEAIWQLKEENGKLKEYIRNNKGGNVSDADESSSVVA